MRLMFALLVLDGLGCGWPRPTMPCRCRARAAALPVRPIRSPAWMWRRFQRADGLRPPAGRPGRRHLDAAADRPGRLRRRDMVELDAVLLPTRRRVAIKPAAVLTCAMAESLAAWLREDGGAATCRSSAARLRAIENYDSYECRTRNRVPGAKLSEHANGDALDVRAFTLADGRRLALTDPTVDKDAARGLARQRLPPLHHRARPRRRLPQRPHPSRRRSSAAMATASANGTCACRPRKSPPRSSAAASATGHGRAR